MCLLAAAFNSHLPPTDGFSTISSLRFRSASLNQIKQRPLSAPRQCHPLVNSHIKKQNHVGVHLSSPTVVVEITPPADEKESLFEAPFVGIKRDYQRRLSHFKSDISDGVNVQCLATTLFLFFACLSPAVGFGALFSAVTCGAIGTIEMVSSTAICGIMYAMFAAQPLTIIGSTGPVLAFVACLMQLANSWNL